MSSLQISDMEIFSKLNSVYDKKVTDIDTISPRSV